VLACFARLGRVVCAAFAACITSFSTVLGVGWRERGIVQVFAIIRELKPRELAVKWSISAQVCLRRLMVWCGLLNFSVRRFSLNF